jgi:hypothetical protein
MSTVSLKNKISKSLDTLDKEQLQSAFLIVKALRNQQKQVGKNFNREILEQKLAKGIQELDNKKGTDFLPFLNKMQERYGSKKQG